MKKQITPDEALVKVQNICASQEKCKADIRKKLYEWKIQTAEIEGIIDKLLKDKFIDESRFAGFYVRDKYKLNKWGKIKIIFSLRQKQIAQNIIDTALETINEDEYENLFQTELEKKLRSIKFAEKHKIKEKLLRFAQGRGYEPDLAISMIDALLAKMEEL